MSLFMDVHEALPEGLTAADVARAHRDDLTAQARYGVRYLRYWVDEQAGKLFCLCEAPSAEALSAVQQKAHGLRADRIYEVREGE